MKSEISSLDLYYLTKELKILENSKVDRIYHSKENNKELLKWVQKKSKYHLNLEGKTTYAFAALVYQILEYSMFSKYLDTDLKNNKYDLRASYNIALLTKFIIDRYIKPIGLNGKMETDVEIAVGAEWSKELFGDRYESDYFPLLNRIQLMARSDELFHYKTSLIKHFL